MSMVVKMAWLSFVNHMLWSVVFEVRLHFCFIFRIGGELLQNIWLGEAAFISRGIWINNALSSILK